MVKRLVRTETDMAIRLTAVGMSTDCALVAEG